MCIRDSLISGLSTLLSAISVSYTHLYSVQKRHGNVMYKYIVIYIYIFYTYICVELSNLDNLEIRNN